MENQTEIDEESYEKKVKFEGEVKCPHCGFFLVVKAGKKILEPSKAAVTEDFFSVEESAQSRLETGISIKDEKKDKDKDISLEPSEKNNKKNKKDPSDIEKITEEDDKKPMGRAPNNTELFKTWITDNNITKFDRQEFIDAYSCITKDKATKIISYQVDKETIRQVGINRFEVIKEL